MRLHRFIGNFDLNKDNFKIFDEEILNQTKNVLRLKKGDSFILADGRLNEAVVKIVELDKKFMEVEILEQTINKNEPETYGILYCSILKRENFELVCQKATEGGIKEIIPLISARTVKLGFKKERLEKIVREAAEQSGRGILPILREPEKFSEALKSAEQNDLNLFFEMDSPLLNKEDLKTEENKKIGIFIGPEGGWSEEELKMVKNEVGKSDKFKMSGLGKTTLRAETAAIVASWFVAQNKK